jgi:DNA-binding CsgD family transcriptional regulator
VTTVSTDVRDVLGWEPAQLIGHSLLAAVHPDDAGPLMRLVESSPLDGATVRSVRLRHATGDWITVQCLVLRVTESGQPPITFVLLPEPPRPPDGADRVAELEIHLRRIAAELRATGVLDDVEGMPLHVQLPELSSLTSRQWQIALRLMRGGRVAAIARELNLSPGTVRNHLAAIYNLLGVHSQADLVELLRGRTPR